MRNYAKNIYYVCYSERKGNGAVAWLGENWVPLVFLGTTNQWTCQIKLLSKALTNF